MSNAMSRSKSRWKGVLLATVATSVVSPLAAKATMTVGLYLNPIGSGLPQTSNYVTPGNNATDVPVYVYAIVTDANAVTPTSGSSASVPVSSGDFAGLQYLYYNVNSTAGTGGGIAGGFETNTSAGLNTALGFGSNSTNGANSSQGGTVRLNTTSAAQSSTSGAVLAIGAIPDAGGNYSSGVSGAQNDFAKPRAAGAVFSNYSTFNGSNYTYKNDGKNIIIGTGTGTGGNGLATNQAAFLVQTLQYKPNLPISGYTGSTSSSSLIQTQLSLTVPTAAQLTGASYAPSNYFTDTPTSVVTVSNASGNSLAPYTQSTYSALHGVTLTEDILGDLNADGAVSIADFNILIGNFGQATGQTYLDGDLNGDGAVSIADFNLLIGNFGTNLGTGAPAIQQYQTFATFAAEHDDTAAFDAAVASNPNFASVPEPTSALLLAVGASGAMLRRRRAIK